MGEGLNTGESPFTHATQLGLLFGVALFACMLVWSQFTPLGAGPDGPSKLRRYAVGVDGDNALNMFSHPVWSPPFGINLSIALLIVTSIGVGAVVMLAERMQRT